ncbi:MAG TPA: chemotaxis-specific protein-glutamate methyltransferase CheB [Hyphomonadaceae bacterium]|nr:chemotaxis-specific protein-glutamate methyltransferase CheB [Hyphomonadaceae bacterium]HPI48064.1 chemotaxis-specific protein-glutamate methyltransferase CheB [Hyphomonadaceae bacterium]
MLVEDSPTVRMLLCHIIDRDPRLQLAAVCVSAEEALESIGRVAPDVISMDIRLPGIDGLEATRRIMSTHPTPIVVIADSVHDATLGIAMNALKAGALTVVEKPAGPGAWAYDQIATMIATQLYIMSQVPVIRRRDIGIKKLAARQLGDVPEARANIVGIAASTGGPPALAAVLGGLHREFPAPVLLVQHMGAPFMEGFASWLGGQTGLRVKLAEDREIPKAGTVYVAPGDRHLELAPGNFLKLTTEPPIASQRPAANALFQSLARVAGSKAVGVLLTGMGEDGARGLLKMREAGAFTIAEDETTSVVYGMPAAAVRMGGASVSLPQDLIAARLTQITAEQSR